MVKMHLHPNPCPECGGPVWGWLKNQRWCSVKCAALSRRVDKDPERFWRNVDQRGPKECWSWKRHVGKTTGRGLVSVNGKRESTSRAAWIFANGEVPGGLFVLHKCDNPACCNPAHLFLGTAIDNVHDMHEKGRAKATPRVAYGECNGSSLLTDAQVELVRCLAAAGHRQNALASRFGVSAPCINAIVVGRNRMRGSFVVSKTVSLPPSKRSGPKPGMLAKRGK